MKYALLIVALTAAAALWAATTSQSDRALPHARAIASIMLERQKSVTRDQFRRFMDHEFDVMDTNHDGIIDSRDTK